MSYKGGQCYGVKSVKETRNRIIFLAIVYDLKIKKFSDAAQSTLESGVPNNRGALITV